MKKDSKNTQNIVFLLSHFILLSQQPCFYDLPPCLPGCRWSASFRVKSLRRERPVPELWSKPFSERACERAPVWERAWLQAGFISLGGPQQAGPLGSATDAWRSRTFPPNWSHVLQSSVLLLSVAPSLDVPWAGPREGPGQAARAQGEALNVSLVPACSPLTPCGSGFTPARTDTTGGDGDGKRGFVKHSLD